MNNLPVVEFRYGFTDVDEFEMPLKGWRDDVVVKCPDGKKYELCFYDPVRLMQSVESEEFIYESGLIIVKEVTLANIEKVVSKMWEENFFDKLKSI